MKASMYNIMLDNGNSGEAILFNSLYGSLTTWSEQETKRVEHILKNPTLTSSESSGIRNILMEQKNLVNDSIDELAIIKNRKTAGIKDKNRLDLVIMPTLNCNFACSYCYEVHQPSRMTDETEMAIKKWLTTEIPKYKFVMLHWFGGEPLLCYPRILTISKHVRDIASNCHIPTAIHITTNGFLLNKSRIKGLMDAEIHDFQITLDGPPETHNRLRVLRNGNGTFDRLFKNINILARAHDRVKISLRVNFNHENLHAIPILLEMFPEEIRHHLRVVYEPIFGHCALSATDNLSNKEISIALSDYYKLAETLGYDIVLGLGGIHSGKLVYCYAERENQVIINYNGDIYKCSVSDFNPAERVGYICSDGSFIKAEENWSRWTGLNLFEEKCFSCAYLPLCMGGCRRMRLSRRETGSYCSLIPTNTSYILKQLAFGSFGDILKRCKEITI